MIKEFEEKKRNVTKRTNNYPSDKKLNGAIIKIVSSLKKESNKQNHNEKEILFNTHSIKKVNVYKTK